MDKFPLKAYPPQHFVLADSIETVQLRHRCPSPAYYHVEGNGRTDGGGHQEENGEDRCHEAILLIFAILTGPVVLSQKTNDNNNDNDGGDNVIVTS